MILSLNSDIKKNALTYKSRAISRLSQYFCVKMIIRKGVILLRFFCCKPFWNGQRKRQGEGGDKKNMQKRSTIRRENDILKIYVRERKTLYLCKE